MKNNSIFEFPVKYAAGILLTIFFIVFACYFYYGITNRKAYSEDYNVPIAESILSGEFLFLQSADNPYAYFPGSSHVFLVPFVLLGFPNLFGLVSFVLLFFVCKKLGDTFGLNKYSSIVFAASVCMTMTVIRTVNDQSIDKWLAAWFVLSLVLLEKPRDTWKFHLLFGFALGMLIGTKYSGPLFFIALIPVYWRVFFRYLAPLRFFLAGSVFTLSGLFWYIRNFLLEGNPYYPAQFLFFKGWPDYTQQDWMLWKIPFDYPEGIIPLINAFLSEYIIWGMSGLVIFWFLLYSIRKRLEIDKKHKRIIVLLITTGFVCLLLPITPAYKIHLFQIISDMRYILIFVILLMLEVFLIAQQYKKDSLLALVAVINAIPPFTYIPYQPKTYLLCLLFIITVYIFQDKVSRKLSFLNRILSF